MRISKWAKTLAIAVPTAAFSTAVAADTAVLTTHNGSGYESGIATTVIKNVSQAVCQELARAASDTATPKRAYGQARVTCISDGGQQAISFKCKNGSCEQSGVVLRP